MKLKWLDFFECVDKKRIKNLYINSFPKEERYPFCIVKRCAKNNNVEFYGIYDEKRFVGLVYVLIYNNTIFLFYLAVQSKYRGNGYGSTILQDLQEKYNNKKIILCIERPDENAENYKSKRKKFYLNNGFYSTNKYTEDNNVIYEVLCSEHGFNVDEKTLSNLYKQMTDGLLFGKLINKIYHIDYVGFIKE